MDNVAMHETCLFKVILLVAGIVVGMFCSTVLVALIFMPSQLIASMPFQDIGFLLPMAFATVCSASVLALYIRSHRSRYRLEGRAG